MMMRCFIPMAFKFKNKMERETEERVRNRPSLREAYSYEYGSRSTAFKMWTTT